MAGRQRMLNQKHARMILAGDDVTGIRKLIMTSLKSFQEGGDSLDLENAGKPYQPLKNIPKQKHPLVVEAMAASEDNFHKVFAIADELVAAKSTSKREELTKQLSVATDASHVTAHGLVTALGKGIADGHTTLKWQMALAGAVTSILGLVVLLSVIIRSAMRPLQLSINRLEESSTSVKEGTEQLAATGQQVAENASTQARAVQSLQEQSNALDKEALEVFEHCEQVEQVATESSNRAEAGTQDATQIGQDLDTSISKLNEEVEAVRSAIDDTSGMVDSISQIAFQTNFLALNASVEAARAGDAGAGFAVVADEVRALATRASEAIRSSEELMGRAKSRSSAVSDAAAELAAELHEQLDKRIVEGFRGFATNASELLAMVTQVSSLSKLQRERIQSLNGEIAEVDGVTQTTAATAEELAAVAESQRNRTAEVEEVALGIATLTSGASSTDKSDEVLHLE